MNYFMYIKKCGRNGYYKPGIDYLQVQQWEVLMRCNKA